MPPDLLARSRELEDKAMRLSTRSGQLERRAREAREASQAVQVRARATRDRADRTLARRVGLWRTLAQILAA